MCAKADRKGGWRVTDRRSRDTHESHMAIGKPVSWSSLMNRLEKIASQAAMLREAIHELNGPGNPYALIDFPNHSNVGDSAIWLGEISLLKAVIGEGPRYVSTIEDFDAGALAAALPTGTVFLHGGGNFGDLWPSHQVFRERLLTLLPNRRIVQLPQSISYSSDESIRRTASALKAHPDFVLMVRDRNSYDLSKERFSCEVRLLPDSAFGLGPLTPTRKATHDALLLLRTDHEVAETDYAPLYAQEIYPVCDWLDESKRQVRWLGNARKILHAPRLRGAQARRLARFNWLARHRLRRGLKILSSADRILTDRLHAHILSTLLGIPHVVLDNVYGKISGYMEHWTSGIDIALPASSATEALNRLASLPSRGAAAGRAPPAKAR